MTPLVIIHGTDISWWPEVEHDGVTWLVCPRYYASPVGIGEAVELAHNDGFELPTPGLVDAIWRAADVKVLPITAAALGQPNRGDDIDQFIAHRVAVDRQVGDRSGRLLAGTHKDVVRVGNKVGIYGWHLSNGSVIQPFYAGHRLSWKDYSQGFRAVRRK